MVLANLYLDETGSSGVPYDKKLGIQWMREAAEGGDDIAQAYIEQHGL